jgi:sulfate transport system ATP-binding protein
VALARALAHKPEVLLLDEPFGALDAKIRAELRRTVRGIQREMGIATIFVTHDQEEAFELADRLGVMSAGRLLEVGPPEELYLRPQTEFVATFLGSANLMVGEATGRGVRLGPIEISLGTQATSSEGTRRVQVLFRPEDVAVKDSPDAVGWPLLGRAVVEESEFVGPVERLRLKLPPIPGVRPISPPTPFGDNFVRVDASRSQHQSRRFPLRAGDFAFVGVRRVHALTHPGLSILAGVDGTSRSKWALDFASQLSSIAHARMTTVKQGSRDGDAEEEQLQPIRRALRRAIPATDPRSLYRAADEALSSEAARGHYDLLVRALPEKGRERIVEGLLGMGEHHLLLVPSARPLPRRALVSVAVGEPGKECIQFAARLLRHIGSEVTLLTVVPEESGDLETEQAGRFLRAGLRTMSLMQVPAVTLIRRGAVVEEILGEMGSRNHDLLVIGTPPPGLDGAVSVDGVVGSVIDRAGDRLVLVVRSQPPPARNGTLTA